MHAMSSLPVPGTSALVLATLALLAGCTAEERRPPDVLLITIDTLRADHLGAYDAASSTPRIDALAAEGAVFERAAAPMPLTRPSHFSMLTALYPREHGVLNNAARLPDDRLSLAEIFAAEGWRTAAFVGVKLLGPQSGSAQGFQTFESPSAVKQVSADAVVPRALAWLSGLPRDERAFLWVHLFDPHLPYEPPPGYRGDVPPGAAAVSWDLLEAVAEANAGDVPAEVLERARALYRGEVSYVDHWVGELLDGVRAVRNIDETVVVFTADHGECFENGVYFEHSDCLWEGAVRIPLIVRWPREFPAGSRAPEQVSIVDVPPTVLRAAGLAVPQGLSGRALQEHAAMGERHVLLQYPLYQRSAAENRPRRQQKIRSVAGEPTAPVLVGRERVGIVGHEWKLLRTGEDEELYRVAPPRNERDDVLAEQPVVAQELRGLLDRQLERHPMSALAPQDLSAEERALLIELGYLLPEPAEDGDPQRTP
jgi:arylsulfatase A-like enzyme